MVGGEPGVGVGCHRGRLDAVGEPNQRALVDEHVLREAAVAREPGEAVALAVHVQAAPAGHAETAAVRRVQDHRVADGGRGHVVPGRVHPAGVLVAEDERQPDACRLHQPVLRMEVGRTHACPADANDDVAGADRLGLGAFDQLERTVVLAEERCLHERCSASRVASAMIVSDGLTDSVRGISDPSPT